MPEGVTQPRGLSYTIHSTLILENWEILENINLIPCTFFLSDSQGERRTFM